MNFEEAPIITAILEGIERPESLAWFEEEELQGLLVYERIKSG
ncbi:hypothetical protein BGP_6202 [Beggiatoa sp. PS]|nr:hypothetical protein BGP_6202 [Beggiatoa sp. PS]